jgi:hypothetical protein
MVAFSSLAKLASVGYAAHTLAHPGHEDHVTDRAVKRSFLVNSRRSLESCAAHLEARGTLKNAEARRRAYLEDLRKKSQSKYSSTPPVPYLQSWEQLIQAILIS